MDSVATARKSRRIRIYPTTEQRAVLRLWDEAGRWCYNKAVELLREGFQGNRYELRAAVLAELPERLEAAPYQVKGSAVFDARKAQNNVKAHNRKVFQTGEGQSAKLHFRSRKHPRSSIFVPRTAITPTGIYKKLLGDMKHGELLPEPWYDSRLVREGDRYWLVVATDAHRTEAETQGRVIALDPGVRSFQTGFSETEAVKFGEQDFGRIARLCHHLDDLMGRIAKAPARKKSRMKNAATRLRRRIKDLVRELHHKVARWLVDHYDIILLPTFETSEMVEKAKRKLNSKVARAMLTWSHYQFAQFLTWKTWESGKVVLRVNEAHTTKTCSWSGEVVANMAGRKTIRGSDGIVLDRDINSARGILLRALEDTPWLREQLVS